MLKGDFRVTGNTNKQWRFRVQLVKELENWVCENLNTRHATWNRKLDKKATLEGKRRKAGQYVTEHLALGKMKYPLEDTDPLFTGSQYDDESMELQLKSGMYPVFQAHVQRQLQRVTNFNVHNVPAVTWEEVSQGMNATSLSRLRELCDQLDEQVDKETEMIGLVLRYQCIGGFTHNFHGSVPASWGTVLDEFTECFASPLNHKFEMYYSMFEQDRVFGSKGNFFRMVEENGGVILPGRYEMNPPWMNAMYERLVDVIEESLLRQNEIQVIIVGPHWTDTKWIPKLNMLLESFQPYRRHSFGNRKRLQYSHDMSGDRFSLDSVYWVFSSGPVSSSLIRCAALDSGANNLFLDIFQCEVSLPSNSKKRKVEHEIS